jgi:hypothetical protein
MNVVLYTVDFEPITVVDLPRWLLDKCEERGFVKISVPQPGKPEPDMLIIRCKRIAWFDGSVKVFLTTEDEVLALGLRPGWLPGQTQVVQSTERLIHKLHNKVVELMRKN